MKKERNIALAVCAVLAALILLLTSQSSPLYPSTCGVTQTACSRWAA